MARQFSINDSSVWNDRYGDFSAGDVEYTGTSTFNNQKALFTGTSGNSTGTINSNPGFMAGDLVLIHQSRNGGSGAGAWEFNKLSNVSGTNLTFTYPLQNSYASTAQIIHIIQHQDITVTGTLNAPNWDGTSGGIVVLMGRSITVNGAISANSAGYRGGLGGNNTNAFNGFAGEGHTAASTATGNSAANGSGGGQGRAVDTSASGGGNANTGGGVGGGSSTGNSALTIATFGGGGGGFSRDNVDSDGTSGGGLIILIAQTVTISSGGVTAHSASSTLTVGGGSPTGSAGTGAGGSILIKGQIITVSSGVSAIAATSGGGSRPGAQGSVGRIHIDYSDSVTGTTSPVATATFDSALDDPNPNYVKANIKVQETPANYVKANILRAYPTSSQAKFNVIPYRGVEPNFVKANIRPIHFEKKYDYRVYNVNGQYITTWTTDVTTEPGFRTVINGGPGEMVVRLDRPFDDFGEDVDVKLFNRVEVWVADVDDFNGTLLYGGHISGYRPVLDGHQEFIEVTLLHDVAQFSEIMLRDSAGDTDVPELSQDPSDMLRNTINKYRADGGRVDYTSTSIEDTNAVASYNFHTYTVKESIDKIIELTPENWYWRVDPDNIIHLHESNLNQADHTFVIGKHISFMETWRRGEDIVNRVYFVGAESGGTNMYRVYSNQGSIDTYGIHALKVVDERVDLTSTADLIANRVINRKKDPEIRTTMVIVDNNGLDRRRGYDIESVKVGQTMRIFGLKQGLKTISYWDISQWDVDVWDQTLTSSAVDTLQIQSVEYAPNAIRIEASSRLPEIAKRVEDVYRNLEQSQTVTTPNSPTTA